MFHVFGTIFPPHEIPSEYKFVYIGTILDRGTKNTEGVLGQFLSRAQRARLKNFFKCLGEAVSIYRKIVIWGRSPNMTIWPKTSEVFFVPRSQNFSVFTQDFLSIKQKENQFEPQNLSFVSSLSSKIITNFFKILFFSVFPVSSINTKSIVAQNPWLLIILNSKDSLV